MNDFEVFCEARTGMVKSVRLYGEELLDPARPCDAELLINGVALKTRLHPAAGGAQPLLCGQSFPLEAMARLKGERFVDHFAGWGLVVSRSMGLRTYARHPCFGIQYLVRREQADQVDLPCPGPGGPVIEAPLYVDTFTLPNLNWRFWGDDTRMIFPSAHSNGPVDEFGHCGHEHDTPENCKKFMRNVWRRIYPGGMVIQGSMFYNIKTGHWLSITCRRPHLGYILNTESAGRGVSYDFTLHAPFNLGDSLTLPEIIFNFGATRESMEKFIADYATAHVKKPPRWVSSTVFREGLAWNNQPSWGDQADLWEHELDEGLFSGIHINLVTDRPVNSGTTPKGYHPDPSHGTQEEFREMCQRMARRGVPMVIWMSHSGLMYRGGPDIEDDWFIRGIDGRICAAWGSEDNPSIAHINPGHPGYIEYVRKWIRFYIRECGCKGIFLDCLGWAFPPDFTPRSFMRYPGDTNRMAVVFVEAVHACIKECDPDAILLGEGWSSDFPVEIFSVVANPVRAIDGLGPRDFLLQLAGKGPRRLYTYDENALNLAGGYCVASTKPGHGKLNKFYTAFLRKAGCGAWDFEPLPGDLAVNRAEGLLAVPSLKDHETYPAILLSGEWEAVPALRPLVDGTPVVRGADGVFSNVPPGIYSLRESAKT
ncbi:MAG: hypothetical protein WAX69_09615 [Victivallales bacterium]